MKSNHPSPDTAGAQPGEWQLVPKKPTSEMLGILWETRDRLEREGLPAGTVYKGAYAAALAAAPTPPAVEALEAETIQTLLGLLNPLHGSLDRQVDDQLTDERELDPPRDREYNVNVTAQQERDLTQAVLILEDRKRQAALANAQSSLPSRTNADARCPTCGAQEPDWNASYASPSSEQGAG